MWTRITCTSFVKMLSDTNTKAGSSNQFTFSKLKSLPFPALHVLAKSLLFPIVPRHPATSANGIQYGIPWIISCTRELSSQFFAVPRRRWFWLATLNSFRSSLRILNAYQPLVRGTPHKNSHMRFFVEFQNFYTVCIIVSTIFAKNSQNKNFIGGSGVKGDVYCQIIIMVWSSVVLQGTNRSPPRRTSRINFGTIHCRISHLSNRVLTWPGGGCNKGVPVIMIERSFLELRVGRLSRA